MAKIIGLCGLEGSGKDTFANILVNSHGYIKMSFGSVLKDVVAAIFGWNRKLLEGDGDESERKWRETVNTWWANKLGIPELTPRWVLNNIGTDLFRDKFNENIFIYALERTIEKTINKHDNIVISDCRFPNEIEWLLKNGGLLVHIYRDNVPDWFIDYKMNGIIPTGIAYSNYAWIPYTKISIEIKNTTIENLKHEAECVTTKYVMNTI